MTLRRSLALVPHPIPDHGQGDALPLTAALDAANAEQDRERARALLDIAFLDLNQARRTFRRLGLWLSPFPNETTEARGRRALRYAERVRRSLTPDDLAAIEAARVQDLR